MGRLIHALLKMGLLSPAGVFSLIKALTKHGINLMALLSFAAENHKDKVVLVDVEETLTYRELLAQSQNLALILKEKYFIEEGQKIGILCRNHSSMIKAIFAISRLGGDIYLLNPEMSNRQLSPLLQEHDFHLLIYDEEFGNKLDELDEKFDYKLHDELASSHGDSTCKKAKFLSNHDELPAINNLVKLPIAENLRIKPTSGSRLVLLTGGTTGNAKKAAHKPSLVNYLNPFLDLLTKLRLMDYSTVYIATPLYHGYGIAFLLLFMALGKKVIIQQRFNPEKACQIISKHQVEVVTVVPSILYKMLRYNSEKLSSLACIISGGAELNGKLVQETFHKLGDKLFNLYGTTETGLNIIATPEDLRYAPNTLGRKITGVELKVIDEGNNQVRDGQIGQFCIKTKWSMKNKINSWIKTGDLGFRDKKGYYFWCGRIDDMIVSGGENVYPAEVEQILRTHPHIEDAAVIGINDEEFGERLKAFVLPDAGVNLEEEELLDWLRPRVARFQTPKEIVILNQMPYTPLGKLDRKYLRSFS